MKIISTLAPVLALSVAPAFAWSKADCLASHSAGYCDAAFSNSSIYSGAGSAEGTTTGPGPNS